jgi:hypothetical protein
LHPELLADSASRALKFGRFTLEYGGGSIIKTFDQAATRSAPSRGAFADVMPLVLRSMTTCRVFDAKRLTKKDRKPPIDDRSAEWLAKYTTEAPGGLDVRSDVRGVRGDLEFWWWILIRGANPIFSVKPSKLDTRALVRGSEQMIYMTLRYDLTATAIKYAAQTAAKHDLICLAPVARGTEFELKMFAGPKRIGDLAKVAANEVAANRIKAGTPTQVVPDTCIVQSEQGFKVFNDRLDLDEPDYRRILAVGAKRLHDTKAAVRALAIAEMVAALEGRPALGMNDLHSRWMNEWLPTAEPVGDETVREAHAAVTLIMRKSAVMQDVFATAEGRALWRAELEGLEKRLKQAVFTRSARAAALNAVPAATTKKPANELLRPEQWKEMRLWALLDDVMDVCDFLREQGATLLAASSDHESLLELPERAVMRDLFDEPLKGFDARVLEKYTDHSLGPTVFPWWRELSPEPAMVDGRVSGWGYAYLFFAGATAKGELLQSVYRYPTGSELGLARYQQHGPWQQCDWKALRKKYLAFRDYLTGPAAGAFIARKEPSPILKRAAGLLRTGHRPVDGYRVALETRR